MRRIAGTIQYQTTAEGEAVDAYLTQWESDHPEATGSDTMAAIDPPHEEGSVVQVTVQYDVADNSQGEALHTELWPNIYGGDVGAAECGSTFGSWDLSGQQPGPFERLRPSVPDSKGSADRCRPSTPTGRSRPEAGTTSGPAVSPCLCRPAR